MLQGRVASYMFDGVPVGPLRIWLADVNIPGLSMTRSFGDKVAANCGHHFGTRDSRAGASSTGQISRALQ